ncbi:glutathione S-transferase family protein [Neorhizobium sp. NPDC001467]|uniref:glutathione S-transferase family protein n=1 Tax=Neorhizobium sp. NPDC001467 TaxID=3390595 RepID=UPI003CFBEEC4
MLTLHLSPGACSRASHIVLAESGLPYTLRRVDFAKEEQGSPAFLKVNPNGRVPVLETERGVLTETVAILAYLAQLAADAGPALAPADPFDFARMQAFNAYLASTVHVAHAHGRRGYRWADEAASQADMTAKVPANMRACFRLIEDEFLVGPHVMGEQYTVADAYLFVLSGWLGSNKVAISEFPRVADHFAWIGERPAVRRALQEEAAL